MSVAPSAAMSKVAARTGGMRVALSKRGPPAAAKPDKGQKRQHSTESIPRPLRSRKSIDGLEALQARSVLRDLRCIVINLERRPDRMDGCAQRLASRCPELRFERFIATDGKSTSIPLAEVSTSWHTARNVVFQKRRAVRKDWKDLDTYKERYLELSPGERGCSSSHVRAWRHCLELAGEANQPLVVLEDDAAPTAEFPQILARALASLPSDADLLYLGYSQAVEWRREVTPELVESEYVWTTVGYIVWPSCARKLLSHLPVSEPVDNWLAGLCAAGEIKAYCVRPKIVLQADAWNVNSDVAHSDEHYWGPCSDIHHSDEFYWGPVDPKVSGIGEMAAGSCFFGIDLSDSEDSSNDL